MEVLSCYSQATSTDKLKLQDFKKSDNNTPEYTLSLKKNMFLNVGLRIEPVP